MSFARALLVAMLFCVSGCGAPKEHDPQFVGKWESGLPVSGGIVSADHSMAGRMNESVRRQQRQMNASGEQGVQLEIRADGSFTMKRWVSLKGLKELIQEHDLKEAKLPESEYVVDGTWHSNGNQVYLTSDRFLPYAMTEKTRRWRHTGASNPPPKSSQLLPLILRRNGHISHFPGDVRPGTHEAGLDFKKLGE